MKAVVQSALSSISIDNLSSYPDAAALYAKLATFENVRTENLVLSTGSDGVIRAMFEAFIEPGDSVLFPQPTFAMYSVYAQMYGASPIAVPYRPSNKGPALSADDIVEAIQSSAPKAVCLPNPDSPTGTVFDLSDMRTIIDAAEAAGALMLVDEAYYPFHDETVLPWINDYPNLIVTRSTGKAWALAGFRIGYAAASPKVAAILHKVRAMYETNTVAVAVFEKMLDHVDDMRASVSRLLAGKAQFLDAMDELGFRTLDGQGNFLHVAFGAKAAAVHRALDGVVYYRRDFDEPCLNGFSRFSAATPAQFAPIIDIIRKAASTESDGK